MISFFRKTLVCALGCVVIFSITACGNKDAKSRGDYLTGNKWETSSGMLLELGNDGNFKWFRNKTDRDNNYYSGTFTTMVAQEAIDYMEDNEGYPEESQRSSMSQFGISEENYYVVVMNNKECIEDGSNTLTEENKLVYFGYYRPDYESLKLYNLGTLGSYDFTKM